MGDRGEGFKAISTGSNSGANLAPLVAKKKGSHGRGNQARKDKTHKSEVLTGGPTFLRKRAKL